MKNEFEKRLLTSLLIIPIALFFIIKGSFFFIFFISTISLITIYEWFKLTKNLIIFKIIGTIFIIFSLYSAYLLRDDKGVYIFLFIIIISILTDVGGYTFGKIFKGPKLTKISPKKTYSGVVGGFLSSIIGGNVYYYSFMADQLNTNQYFLISIFIFFISLISQLGDLIVSFFKRIVKTKDTGKILPGHGGLLDRIDGIIFTIPSGYAIIKYFIF